MNWHRDCVRGAFTGTHLSLVLRQHKEGGKGQKTQPEWVLRAWRQVPLACLFKAPN